MVQDQLLREHREPHPLGLAVDVLGGAYPLLVEKAAHVDWLALIVAMTSSSGASPSASSPSSSFAGGGPWSWSCSGSLNEAVGFSLGERMLKNRSKSHSKVSESSWFLTIVACRASRTTLRSPRPTCCKACRASRHSAGETRSWWRRKTRTKSFITESIRLRSCS